MLIFILASSLLFAPQDDRQKSSAAPPAEQAPAQRQQVGAQRNENIQINLIDNNAVNERIRRQGLDVRPLSDFSATRANYAAEFGGIGRNLEIVPSEDRPEYHGEVYENLQNSSFNARTFFQVGSVRPYRRNQYGFNVGGPLVRNRQLSFLLTGEEIRQSGYVNGNVLVPTSQERTPRTSNPQAFALISRLLGFYPKELPNRTEIDPRMLNTNAPQTIRTSGGSLRLDWMPAPGNKYAMRYSFQDTAIDSFEFVLGQNPNQRLRPQTLNLSLERQFSPATTFRFGFNYIRRKAHLMVPPGAEGPTYVVSREIEDLGAKTQFPISRVANEFEYLVHASRAMRAHSLDWGAEVRRQQVNDLQSDDTRGRMGFNANFGRSATENLLLGVPSWYRLTVGNLYRGFRTQDFNFFFNDRARITPRLQINLGLRYEFVTKPTEVNNLTRYPFDSDKNNAGPRAGLAYSAGPYLLRAGYGIAFGRIFPGTYQWSRFNPPEVLGLYFTNPDMLNPLGDYQLQSGEPRSLLRRMDPNLVVPYSHQYTIEFERELPAQLRLRTSYIASRTWKLFHIVYANRGGRPSGIPVVTATVNARRADQRYFGVETMTNMGRAYFDAGQLVLEKSAGHGLSLRATYTFSKAIDTGSEFASTAVNDDELRSQSEGEIVRDLKALSRFDSPHSLALVYSYRLPGRILQGWTVSGTTLFRSGPPFTIESGTDSPPWGNVDGDRQDRPSILDPSILYRSVDHPDTSQQVLRRDAFSTAATFAAGRGNLGRNTFRKDGISNFNVALARVFRLPGDPAPDITFRAEAINFMNHPQFDSPNFNLASASFGQITNTSNSGRILQFGLSFRF